MVVDGQEQKVYDEIGSLLFSPDSKQLAYVARRAGEKCFVVVDGQEQKQYAWIQERSSLVSSPDSRRLAYVADLEPFGSRKWFVVVDGQEQKVYDRIEEGSLLFSPDSKRLAYVAVGGTNLFVVVEGHEQKQYGGGRYEIEEGSLIFSPDSQRVAWVVARDLEGDGHRSQFLWRVDVDDQEGKVACRSSPSVVFSPDSRRVAYVADLRGSLVVVDGREGNRYDNIQGSIIFDSPDQLHYIARKGNAFYLIEERLA